MELVTPVGVFQCVGWRQGRRDASHQQHWVCSQLASDVVPVRRRSGQVASSKTVVATQSNAVVLFPPKGFHSQQDTSAPTRCRWLGLMARVGFHP